MELNYRDEIERKNSMLPIFFSRFRNTKILSIESRSIYANRCR